MMVLHGVSVGVVSSDSESLNWYAAAATVVCVVSLPAAHATMQAY